MAICGPAKNGNTSGLGTRGKWHRCCKTKHSSAHLCIPSCPAVQLPLCSPQSTHHTTKLQNAFAVNALRTWMQRMVSRLSNAAGRPLHPKQHTQLPNQQTALLFLYAPGCSARCHGCPGSRGSGRPCRTRSGGGPPPPAPQSGSGLRGNKGCIDTGKVGGNALARSTGGVLEKMQRHVHMTKTIQFSSQHQSASRESALATRSRQRQPPPC